jgi:hypothetical protein
LSADGIARAIRRSGRSKGSHNNDEFARKQVSSPYSLAAIATAVISIFAIVVATIAVMAGGGEHDAGSSLAAAQSFVRAASSYRFDADAEFTTTSGTGRRAGSTTTAHSAATGSWTRDSWQIEYEDEFESGEMRRVGDTMYTRVGDAAQWITQPFRVTTRTDLLDMLRETRDSFDVAIDEEGGDRIDAQIDQFVTGFAMQF